MKIILFLLLPISVSAQSVGVGHSVKFWGQAENMINVNVAYDDFALHYFHSFDSQDYFVEIDSQRHEAGKINNAFALSWTPLRHKYIYSGIMISSKKYPVEKGTHLNFIVGIEIPFNRFSISYKHTSNGFGIQNPINVGADFITLYIRL